MTARVRPLLAIIVVAGGLVTAALIGLVIGRLMPAKRPPPVLAMAEAPAERGARAGDDQRRHRRPPPVALSGSAPGEPGGVVGKPEDAKRHLQDKLEQALRQHGAETIDSRWAATTNSLIEQDLRPLSEAVGFNLGKIDCRTTRCTVDVSWPTRDAAVESYRRLLWQPIRANCARFILIPDGPGAEKSSAKLMLNCESWREAGAVVMEGLPSMPVP